MANTKRGPRGKKPKQETNGVKGFTTEQFENISKATSQIVQDAAALLDEELAAGIVTAKKVQQRFQGEQRIDPDDFKDALQRFQNDGHDVVNLLNGQVEQLRADDNSELITRLMNNSHDLLDVAVGLVNMGVEITNQLVQNNFPKPKTGGNPRQGS